MKSDRLNNFQKQETAKWLLNISQAAIVGGSGSYFIPGIGNQIGISGVFELIIIGLVLYILAMLYGRKVKDVN